MTGYSKAEQAGRTKPTPKGRGRTAVVVSDAQREVDQKLIDDIYVAVGQHVTQSTQEDRQARIARLKGEWMMATPEEKQQKVIEARAPDPETGKRPTQAQAAAKLGVSSRVVKKVERGTRAPSGGTDAPTPTYPPESQERIDAAKAVQVWHAAWSDILHATEKADPEAIVPRLGSGELPALRMNVATVREWLDSVESHIGPDLRAVKGGKA